MPSLSFKKMHPIVSEIIYLITYLFLNKWAHKKKIKWVSV